MQTIDLTPGTHIETAAEALVKHAPARATLNGIAIRARYATTKASDIVNQWSRTSELRSVAWQHSPEGKRVAAEQEQRTRECQATVDAHVETLPSLDFNDPAAVLAWADGIAYAADRVGVRYDHAAVVAAFMTWDWHPGANCGAEFNADSARNFAGWIVGQWLASKAPLVSTFSAQWRERFQRTDAAA